MQVSQIDTTNQAEAINKIYKKNLQLKGIAEIIRVKWAKQTLTIGKKVALLYLNIAEPEQANRLIKQGLI